jgi:hypothetical protein
MLTLFWDMEGTILVHLTPKGETVNTFPFVWPNERRSLVKDATKKLFFSD